MTFHIISVDGAFKHPGQKGQINDLSFEIFGNVAPFIEITLASTQGLVCERDRILQRDARLAVKPWPGLGVSRKLIVNATSDAELKVTMSVGSAGFAGAFDLSDYGGRLLCPSSALVGNGPGITATSYAQFHELGVGLVQLEGNGWVFLASCGDVRETRLAPGQQSCVRAQSVVAMTATVDFDPASSICNVDGDDGVPEFATLTGPGTVWLQSIATASMPRKLTDKIEPDHDLPQVQNVGLAFMNRNGA